ncbi:MAG: hypothetical protein L0228_05380 [Planctomycetes bacterium]|nr:hypothetical protein [Planctomycetota bacterium]
MPNPSIRRDWDVAMYVAIGLVGITICSVLHFIAGFIAFSISFSLGMDRFDDGGDPSFIEKLSNIAVNILWFPAWLVADAVNLHNDLAEWALVIGNSVIWGIASFGILATIARVYGVRQFSLRTMMIGTTLIALLFGLVAVLT